MRKILWLLMMFALSLAACETGDEPLPEDEEVGEAQDEILLDPLTRCALHLPGATAYELGHVTSNDMPMSPFAAAPYSMTPLPTTGLPFLAHAANGENWSGDIGSQGTQFDGLGHFGYIPGPWIPSMGPFPVDDVRYFGGLTQADVKPTPTSPLLALGVETAAPIMTTALILDVQEYLGDAMVPGEVVTKAMIQATLPRPILSGDAVFIRTGYGSRWYSDPTYYTQGPGLAKDAVDYLGSKGISVVGLDNPFTDPFQPCQLTGACGSPNGADPSLPFYSHHAMLSQYGVHQIQNMNLDQIADDDVEVACAVLMPLRLKGAGSSPIRPVAYAR